MTLLPGFPRDGIVTSHTVTEAVREQAGRIAEEIRRFLDRTPPQVRSAIFDEGIYLAGGSTQIPGLDRFLTQYLSCPVQLSQYFDLCTICGLKRADQPSGSSALGLRSKNEKILTGSVFMKKKKKFQIKSKHLLAIMTGICISAVALTVTETVSIAPLRDAAGMLIVPFQNGINQVEAGCRICRRVSGM